jgi:alpha-mannosidase
MREVSGSGFAKLIAGFALTAATPLLIAIGASFATQANAQSGGQDAILKSLTPDTRAVVERLAQLNRLPSQEWRYHAGDIPHGESPALDDSSWQVIKPRRKISDDAVWFRRLVEVPTILNGYDLTGARI